MEDFIVRDSSLKPFQPKGPKPHTSWPLGPQSLDRDLGFGVWGFWGLEVRVQA